MTLEQIKADIKSGKCTRIYYAPRNCWWTHADQDVLEATVQGDLASEISNRRFLADPAVPEEKKARVKSLLEARTPGPSRIPLDPSGGPLFQSDDPAKFIQMAEDNASHYGKFGIEAFLKAHHQNCGGIVSSKWSDYNIMLEIN